MRWFILGFALFIQSSFAQVTIQGTVTSSIDQTTPIIDASVQISRLDITGPDTLRTSLGSVRTDQNGRFSYQLVTDVQETEWSVAKQFTLSGNYPNPFQSKTQVGLDVPKPDNFTVTVYNILGQQVAHLQRSLVRGSYAIQWDGSDVPGVYFLHVQSGKESRYIKLLQLQKNRGAATLQITGVSNSLLAKTAGSPRLTVAPYVQVTVSKPLFQTYRSPALTYSTQSLDVPLTYVGTGPISASRRDSALKQTSAQFKSLMSSLPKSQAAQAMADWLRKQPQFEDAGAADDGNVWCRFTDGTTAIFVNNFKIGDTSNPNPKVFSRPPQYKVNSAPPTEIPGTNTIVLTNSLGGAFLSPAGWLDALSFGVGYRSEYLSDVGLSISNVVRLKTYNFQEAGVACFFGHGGYGYVPGGGSEYAVWTRTERSAYYDSLFADDLKEHRLVWMYAMYDIDYTKPAAPDTTLQWNYAFTGQFVRKYMTFGKNTLVYVGACSSATNNVFVNSFLAKGASVFAGYTNTAFADYIRSSVMYLMDRGMGRNFGTIVAPEDPPQRAFDWPAVLSWMQSKHLDYGAGDGSTKLVLLAKDGSKLGPLAPSIATMSVHPYEQKLYIYGMFGENPGPDGVVTIGSVPSQVLEWAYDGQTQMDRIVCKIPDDGAGSFGNVQVKVRGITSNVTPLSRYKGNFTLVHETNDGRRYEVKLTLQFRVQMSGFRMKPGEKPMFNQATYAVYADMGSKGEYTASGSTGGQVTWSGHGPDLHNNIDGAANPRSYVAGAWFDPEKMKMQFFMSGGIENGIIQTVGSTGSTMLLVYGLDEFDGKNGYLPSYVEIPLQPNFSITKDKRSAKKVATYYSMLAPMADTVRIEWDDITCEAPPRPETAR